MPNYRRPWVTGATYFITIVTYRRRHLFVNDAIVHRWRRALAQTRRERPFEIHAAVVLPDHVHLMMSLPDHDADVSSKIGRAKALLTKAMVVTKSNTSPSRHRHREADVWQRRFFDHLIRDEADYESRIDYIHYNPVKHGYAVSPKDWPYSSFPRWVENGVYPPEWGCPHSECVLNFRGIETLVGE